MATKIDSIRVNGQDYDFTLSSTTDLSINSLTVTGTVEANTISADTANLSVIKPSSQTTPVSIHKAQLIDYSTTSTSLYPDYMEFYGDYISVGHDGLLPTQREYSHYYFPDKTISGGAALVGTTSYKLVCTKDLDELKEKLLYKHTVKMSFSGSTYSQGMRTPRFIAYFTYYDNDSSKFNSTSASDIRTKLQEYIGDLGNSGTEHEIKSICGYYVPQGSNAKYPAFLSDITNSTVYFYTLSSTLSTPSSFSVSSWAMTEV